jgi:hypothetical protein
MMTTSSSHDSLAAGFDWIVDWMPTRMKEGDALVPFVVHHILLLL